MKNLNDYREFLNESGKNSWRKEAKKQIETILQENENKIFMGFVNHFYGPLRGLSFQISNPNVNEILDLLDSQNIPRDEEYLEGILKRLEKQSPQSLSEICAKIWKYTGLKADLMILPSDLIKQAENPPVTYSSFKEAIKGVDRDLVITADLQKKDPFFFRVGII